MPAAPRQTGPLPPYGWMGSSWFSSAYHNNDAVCRLLVFTIMAGALMFAASVPDLFDDSQSVLAVAGYAGMRLAQVALRRCHPS